MGTGIGKGGLGRHRGGDSPQPCGLPRRKFFRKPVCREVVGDEHSPLVPHSCTFN